MSWVPPEFKRARAECQHCGTVGLKDAITRHERVCPHRSVKGKERGECRWCGESGAPNFITLHELACPNQGRLFRSLGKTFRVKPDAPGALKPVADRVSWIRYEDGKEHPIMQDFIFELYRLHPKVIERLGIYRQNGINFFVFRVRVQTIPTDAYIEVCDKIWKAIGRTKRIRED